MALFATDILNSYLSYLESGRVQKHIFQAVNETSAIIADRIFNSEEGAKDVKNKLLGAYSKQYGAARKKKGYQNAIKDLEVTGDLRRSIKVAKTDLGGKIFLDNEINIKKAGYIEKYQATKKGNDKIFKISKTEIKYCVDKYNLLINKDIQKLIKK